MHQGPLATSVAQLKALLARVLGGGVPLPRASKVSVLTSPHSICMDHHWTSSTWGCCECPEQGDCLLT